MPSATSLLRQSGVAQEKLFTLKRPPKHFVESPVPSAAPSRPRKKGKTLPYSTFILVLSSWNVIPVYLRRQSPCVYV